MFLRRTSSILAIAVRHPAVKGRFASSLQHLKDRKELAGVHQILYHHGITEGICNHLSAMSHDGDREVMLISPYGRLWWEVSASSLLAVSEADVKAGNTTGVETSALTIHWSIHETRPDARVVLHTHPPYGTALACLREPRLAMCHQNCIRFIGDIAYDTDFGGASTDMDEGSRIAAQLGTNANVLVMQNHGITVLGPNVAQAFDRLYYFERACRSFFMARATGLPVSDVSEVWDENQLQEHREYCLKFEQDTAQIHFEAELRKLRHHGSNFEN